MNNLIKNISRVFYILMGSFISSVAVSELIVPHHLLSGGALGISLIIQYVTGLTAGIFVLIINIPIFIIGMREIDRDFIVYSFIGMVSNSIFLILLKNISIFKFLFIDDIMLSSIFGGALNGLGAGIVFRNRASTGGLDIVVVILRKHISLNIGTISFLANLFIISVSSLINGVKPAMFTLVSMYISSNVLDRVQEGLNRKKTVFIVTEKEDDVAKALLIDLHRGVTLLKGEGAYTRHERRIIYCIITINQLSKLKHIVEAVDPKAFMVVSDASEVSGKGFKSKNI